MQELPTTSSFHPPRAVTPDEHALAVSSALSPSAREFVPRARMTRENETTPRQPLQGLEEDAVVLRPGKGIGFPGGEHISSPGTPPRRLPAKDDLSLSLSPPGFPSVEKNGDAAAEGRALPQLFGYGVSGAATSQFQAPLQDANGQGQYSLFGF